MSQFRKKYKVISNLMAAKLLLRRAGEHCPILVWYMSLASQHSWVRSPESSTIKPYCSNSYRMQFTVACWKMQALPWKRCFREALMRIPDVQAVNSIDTHAPQYHQHCRLLNRALITTQIPALLFSLEVVASMCSKKNFKFRFIWQQSSFTHWQRWL